MQLEMPAQALTQERSIRRQWKDYLHVFTTEQKLISNRMLTV